MFWVRTDDGVEAYDDKRKLFEAAGEQATLAGGKVLSRADVALVFSYAEGYEDRGVKAALALGEQTDLAYAFDLSAEEDPTYNRNNLISDTTWCSAVGQATALMGAAGGGHTAMVQRLLAAGARTDAVERQLGATALGAAGIGGNAEILALLLDANMQPDAKNGDGFTALHYRAAVGDVASVTLLLARGASANAANNSNETPLLRAAAAGHAEVVTMLLDAGASIDHTSKDGFTALMLAADKGHLETAKILLARGADRTISNLALKRAADYARLACHTDIEALLAPPPRELPKVTPRTVSPGEAQAASKRLIDACWSDDLDQAATANLARQWRPMLDAITGQLLVSVRGRVPRQLRVVSSLPGCAAGCWSGARMSRVPRPVGPRARARGDGDDDAPRGCARPALAGPASTARNTVWLSVM